MNDHLEEYVQQEQIKMLQLDNEDLKQLGIIAGAQNLEEETKDSTA